MSSKESARDPMPRLWNYRHDDKSTWEFLDCVIAGKDDLPYVSKWIRNPDFKYGYLTRRN
jgi:hypothetical protein